MKKTAGSDILHKPGDASSTMEATSRDVERQKTEERERSWGLEEGVVVVDNVVFSSPDSSAN